MIKHLLLSVLTAGFLSTLGTLGTSGTLLAHEGHAHKVLGTIAAVQANRVELKTPEGKVVTVTVNAKTTYARGKQKVDVSALKVGERIVAEVASEKDMIATSVTMAAAAPVAAR